MPVQDAAYQRALERLDAIELAALLERLPQVVMALRGDGPFAAHPGSPHGGPGTLPAAVPAVATVLSRPEAVVARVRSLDRFCFQLVVLAAWHGGELGHDDAIAEAGPDLGDALEAAAERLRSCCLAERDTAWLALLPGVAECVGLDGIPARDYLERLANDDLATMLRNLGIDRVDSRRPARLDALEAALRDPSVVSRALDEVPGELRSLLDLLLDVGGVLPLYALAENLDVLGGLLDLGFEQLYAFRPVPPRQERRLGGGTGRTTLHWLTERGLVGIDLRFGAIFVPIDVQLALRGRVFAEWLVEPDVELEPLVDRAPSLPPVLAQLDAQLRHWEDEPVEGLKSGGIGVRAIRRTASLLGVTAGAAGLLTHLAVELDLLASVTTGGTPQGRSPDTVWTTTAEADDFRELTATRRWALLVAAWRDTTAFEERGGLPERLEAGYGEFCGSPVERRALLEALASLPAGQGVDLEGLAVLLDHRHPTIEMIDGLDEMVTVLRLLGVVPPEGPVGLSTLGRALVTAGPDAADQLLPPLAAVFTVQPDHSVISPPELDPDVIARLERYAVRESSAGASIHRLDEARIARALDAGDTAEQILRFLSEHTTAALPQNVEVLVGDIERRHGRVRVGAATSYVTSDDPALIVEAVGIKPAKLRQLAPTVAVSSLSRTKLLATLSAKGLMPVAEGADGTQLIKKRQVAEPELYTPGPPEVPEDGLIAGAAGGGDLVELAQRILATRDLASARSLRQGRDR